MTQHPSISVGTTAVCLKSALIRPTGICSQASAPRRSETRTPAVTFLGQSMTSAACVAEPRRLTYWVSISCVRALAIFRFNQIPRMKNAQGLRCWVMLYRFGRGMGHAIGKNAKGC